MKRSLKEKELILAIRILVMFFIGALIVSGITAFPLEKELNILCRILSIDVGVSAESLSGFKHWIAQVNEGIVETNKNYPFLFYGTDWLAFSHIIIAIAFIGLYFQPVRYKWLIYWAMIACIGIIPLALICGHIRCIPFYWQMIDCAFGVFGFVPLYLLHVLVSKLEFVSGYVEQKY